MVTARSITRALCLCLLVACGGGDGGARSDGGPLDAGGDLPRPGEAGSAADGPAKLDAAPVKLDASTPTSDAAVKTDVPRDSTPAPADGPSTGPTALLVVGKEPLGAGDAALKQRLATLGFQVIVAIATSNAEAQAARDLAAGKSLVVITQTLDASNVPVAVFRDVPVPLICMEPFLFDDVRMVEPRNGDGVGYVENQTQVEIVNANHALAAGQKTGRRQVTTAPRWFTWGRPLTAAIKVATVAGSSSQGLVFAYEKGADMWKMTAPARRVALFPHDSAIPVLNDTGWALVDAAVRWAAAR